MAGGIVIAGTHSGSGKTSVTMAVLRALRSKGVGVQPFKVGPDYVDPAFHGLVAGRVSRNLDPWMMGEENVRSVYERWSSLSDVSVVEGVMGMYDGFGSGDSSGSTAHVARLLGLPVVLVVDCHGIGWSGGAIVLGYRQFDPGVRLEAVILNNTRNDDHFKLVKAAVEGSTGVPVFGCLPKRPAVTIPDRRLGLVYPGDVEDLESRLETLGDMARETIDLDRLLALAATAPGVHAQGAPAGRVGQAVMAAGQPGGSGTPPVAPPVRVAVAMDSAFHFYYRDNLDFLEKLGAKIVCFSPLEDDGLPPGIAGLYLGGGYPELHAAQMEANATLRAEILDLIRQGLPVYAECGGLMYLGRSIEDLDGRSSSMVGAIPGRTRMTGSLVNFGYVTAVATGDSVATTRGMELRGHEFHHSVFSLDEPVGDKVSTVLRCRRGRNGRVEREWTCGYVVNKVFASHLHVHFLGNPGVAARFVESCREFMAGKPPLLGPLTWET